MSSQSYTRFPAGPARQKSDKATARPMSLFSRPPASAPAQSGHDADQPPISALSRPTAQAVSLAWISWGFLLACCIPLSFTIGSLSLSVVRIFLLIAFVPLCILYLRGRGGRVLVSDIALLLFTCWMALSMFKYGGGGQIEFIGITTVEFLTPYLLARCLIRSAAQYRRMLLFMLALICIIVAGLIYEVQTGIQIYNRLLAPFGQVYPPVPDRYELRLGMVRGQGVFPHPILLGVAMSLFLAPMLYLPPRQSGWRGFLRTLPVMLATFFSLSAGAWLSGVVQLGLMAWNRVFHFARKRWKILIGIVVFAYLAIDLASSRNPFEVFITYATMDPSTAYWRVLIFTYGMQNVMNHPLFGLGLGDWARPYFMHSNSVDNFWLVMTMRHGIPAFLLIATAWIGMIVSLGRAKLADPMIAKQRNALIYALIGVTISLCTVHIWYSAQYLVFFMLGAGSWMLEEQTSDS